MAAGNAKQSTGLREELSLAARRFNAWWEGYAFSAEEERLRIRADLGLQDTDVLSTADVIARALWGAGRLDPGDPAWTLRHARTLSLPLKADVAVLGAGAGAPLNDLKTATRWKLHGYSRFADGRGRPKLQTYDAAAMRLDRAIVDGGLCFFDLHRDRDPTALAIFAGELARPGAPFCFVDFVAARRGARLGGCFAEPLPGTAYTVEQLTSVMEAGGFRVSDTVDETRSFTPLIAKGWARWRDAYRLGGEAGDTRGRAEYLRALAGMAHLWAERFDALRAGHLRVVRFQTRRV